MMLHNFLYLQVKDFFYIKLVQPFRRLARIEKRQTDKEFKILLFGFQYRVNNFMHLKHTQVILISRH